MSGVSSKAAGKTENKKLYAANELQSKEFADGSGLDFYDFNARTYDQQIGRFLQIDPLTDGGGQESWSPYHSCFNNPISNTDPDGKHPLWTILKTAYQAYRTYKTVEAVSELAKTSERLNMPKETSVAMVIRTDSKGNLSAIPEAFAKLFPESGAAAGAPGAIAVNLGAAAANAPAAVVGNLEVGAAGAPTAVAGTLGVGAASVVDARSKNKLQPDNTADGPHSTFKRDQNGDIYKYETWKENTNPRDPNKFVSENNRFDGGKPDGTPGQPHNGIPTPHINDPNLLLGARAATVNEFPQNLRFFRP